MLKLKTIFDLAGYSLALIIYNQCQFTFKKSEKNRFGQVAFFNRLLLISLITVRNVIVLTKTNIG